MRALALLGLFVGMGVLLAQEPVQDKKDKFPPKGEKRGGERFGPISWKKLLETSDKDKDGLLSKEELSGGRDMWSRWSKADVDMDGKLSEKEFNDYQKKLMDRFKGGKGREEKKKD